MYCWRKRGVLLGLIVLLALGGCGKKGPLYLPDGTAAAGGARAAAATGAV